MPRSTPLREIPPPLELECLNALWRSGECTVRKVQKELAREPKLAYTTVMTVLRRLEKRGTVSRRKQGRSFLYAAKVSREAIRKLALKEFLNAFFDGSPDALIRYLQDRDSAISSPIASDAVAAGLGALTTCSSPGPSTK
jgi:BlaI family transcriptional regulator, penicillinase repressor